MREVRRLLASRAELLSTGVYTPEASVIRQLDARLLALANTQQG
jgi:hypothetical protein